MKIVAKDNFDRDGFSEWLVAENVKNNYLGKIMVSALNNSSGENGSWYFQLVEDDYKLYVFEP